MKSEISTKQNIDTSIEESLWSKSKKNPINYQFKPKK